jgi:uncharacterized RDD family membrane protein YckC
MKTYQRTSVLTLTVAGTLLLGALIPAPEANAARQDADSPSGTPASRAAAGQAQAEATDATAANDVTNQPSTTDDITNQRPPQMGVNREAVVVFGKDVELKAGDSAEAVVVLFGSAKIRGKVHDAAVAVFGDIDVEGGEVGDAAVAVMGSVKAGPGSKIHGEAVAVGGTLDVSEGATVSGEKVAITLPGLHADWLKKWFLHCVLKLRPLAPQVGWVWAVAAMFFVVYLCIAVLFQRPVAACVEELTRRPATTFVLGLLALLLLPLILLILAVTGLGLLVMPFLLVALLLGAIVGKIALIESLGFKLGRLLGVGALQKPLAAFLLGSLLVTLLYLVWVVGLLTYMMLSVWGLGVAVTAAFGGLRREQPAKRVPPPAAREGSLAAAAATVVAPGYTSAATGAEPQTQPLPPNMAAPPSPTVPDVLSYPKAGFWERMAAAFLDVVLVSILGAMTHEPVLWLLISLAYFAGMWTWKGTTIGGIVLGLKVARLDGRPLTFVVALVRALAAAFSVIILFLGFLWIAWDADKQGWHDRIAGTVVLQLPRGTPLVCL